MPSLPRTPNAAPLYRPLLNAVVTIGIIMVLGTLLGEWFSNTTGFSLPSYVGAMIVAVVFRNINDHVKLQELDHAAVGLISKFTLGFFLTMAMMSLKIWGRASLGHGLGGTPNAMANMDALNQQFGVRSERAFLIVPLAGAVLIDIVALPWIVFCMNWVE